MEIAQPGVVEKIKTLRSEGYSMRTIADEVKVSCGLAAISGGSN